jgi:multiple sugar transport system permease protein
MILKADKYKKVLAYAILILASIFFVFPFAWILIGSFQTDQQLLSSPPSILPNADFLVNYKAVLLGEFYGPYKVMVPTAITWIPRSIINSTIVAVFSSIMAILVSSPLAFVLASFKFRGRDMITFSTIIVRTLPISALIIPLYLVMKNLKLINSYWALIITYTATLLPYGIWMLTASFQTIPKDILDSSTVDGCSKIQTLYKIVFPVSAPGMVVTLIFCFLLCWNEFLVALTLATSPDTYTLPVVISMFANLPQMTPYSLMLASAVLGALPPMILVLIFQKYIVSGLIAGAVKG